MKEHTHISVCTDSAGRRLVCKSARSVEKRAQLAREAEVLRFLAHDNVVQYKDFDSRGLWLENIDGIELRQLQGGPMPYNTVSCLAWGILTALESVHRAGYVHGDISPRNVMVTRKGQVKLLDFGLASRIAAEPDEQVYGTMGYLSPEKAKRRPLDERSDLFSVGVLLYELLSGTRYRPLNRRNAFAKAFNGDTAPALYSVRPGVPEAMNNLVSRLLAPERRDRPCTAAEARTYLSSPRAEDMAQLAYDIGRLMTPGRRWGAPRIAMVAAMTLAVGFAGYAVGYRAPDPPTIVFPAIPDPEPAKRPIYVMYAPQETARAKARVHRPKKRELNARRETVKESSARVQVSQETRVPMPAGALPETKAKPPHQSHTVDQRALRPQGIAVSMAHCYGYTHIVDLSGAPPLPCPGDKTQLEEEQD